MSDARNKNSVQSNCPKTKKPYIKPLITTEDLMTFGAACNGTAGGGRKATTASPNFCSASKIKS